MVHTETLKVLSEGGFYSANLTERVRDVVRASGVRVGSVLVFYRHTTGTVLLTEHEAGILVDLRDALERTAAEGEEYKHHLRGYDLNGAAHVRNALLGVSVTIPIAEGNMLLGTYQEILMIDMDTDYRERSIVVQVTGE